MAGGGGGRGIGVVHASLVQRMGESCVRSLGWKVGLAPVFQGPLGKPGGVWRWWDTLYATVCHYMVGKGSWM